MNERLRKLRKALGMTLEEFGDTIGLSKSSIGHIEKGNIKLTDRNINIICNVHNVNKDWLKTGVGDMFNDDSYERQLKELIDKFHANNAINVEFIKLILELNDDTQVKIVEDLIKKFHELNNLNT